MTPPSYRIAIVGAGRLGSALGTALSAAGLAVSGPLRRGERVPASDVVLLCVPDREIATAAAAIAPGPIVGHCSGLTGLDALAPHEAFAFHPLMTVTGGGGGASAPFNGAAAAIAATSARARDVARALAESLGMDAIELVDDRRAIYHAAASLASNYLVTIESAAASLARHAGIERRHVLALARAALENWGREGSAALTGPLTRGDDDTVARQTAAVATFDPALLPLWEALTSATRALASRTTGGEDPR
jgi:predicted short-subunit dehydrogenase-like oxidoreductase (DUF2520 family)